MGLKFAEKLVVQLVEPFFLKISFVEPHSKTYEGFPSELISFKGELVVWEIHVEPLLEDIPSFRCTN